MKILIDKITENDICVIKNQISSDNLYIHGIALRCKYGYPSIVVLNPILEEISEKINYTAFKNPLWLTCPHLNKKIHEIEDNGAIQKIRNLIQTDRTYVNMMEDANAHYYFFRKDLFFEVTNSEFGNSMIDHFNSGIGGTKNPKAIKCLHMQYAHYKFCKSNLAGKITDIMLDGDESCEKEYCKCWKC